MTHNEISLLVSIEKKALYGMEIDRITRKIQSLDKAYSTLLGYLENELNYFKEELERESRFCEYLVNEINKEKGEQQ